MQTEEVSTLEVKTYGNLCVMDETGDSRIQWDKNNPAEIAKAKARFDDLRAKGFMAYKVNKSGAMGEVIDRFDPDAERIILHSQMIGG